MIIEWWDNDGRIETNRQKDCELGSPTAWWWWGQHPRWPGAPCCQRGNMASRVERWYPRRSGHHRYRLHLLLLLPRRAGHHPRARHRDPPPPVRIHCCLRCCTSETERERRKQIYGCSLTTMCRAKSTLYLIVERGGGQRKGMKIPPREARHGICLWDFGRFNCRRGEQAGFIGFAEFNSKRTKLICYRCSGWWASD